MRIILLTSSSTKSGGSRQALYLAQGLEARGHEVLFFTPDHATLRGLAPGASFWRDLGPQKSWRNVLESAIGRNKGPCVVHAFHNAAVKRLAWWGLFWRSRGVVTLAHRGVIFRPNNPLPYWSPGIDCFAVNSRACGVVLRRMGVGQKRLELVYNAVPQERVTPVTDKETMRRELELADGGFLFATVVNNSPVKGVEPLLRAFADARLPRARLLLLGVDAELWLPLCRDLGIVSQVRLVGPTNAVADHLQLADAFVLPSLSESMPNTLLEAIRMHLPSVCSSVGGVPEVLANSGILVPPGDVAALSVALRRMAEDTEAREAMQRAAVAQSPNFDQEKRIDRLAGIYQRLLIQRGLA